MQKSACIAAIFTLTVIACNTPEEDSTGEVPAITNTITAPHADTVVNFAFVDNFFTELSKFTVRRMARSSTIINKIEENIHDPRYMDTVASYMEAGDTVQLFMGGENKFPLSAVITSPYFMINGKKVVGMSRADIEIALRVANTKWDVMMITDQEAANEVWLFFENDVVKKVKFEAVYVD